MMVSRSTSKVYVGLVGVIGALIVGCGNAPTDSGGVETGGMEIQVQMAGALEKRSAVSKTDFDSLVVEISGENMDTIRSVRRIEFNDRFLVDTLSDIPAGSDRLVSVYTINMEKDTIHVDSLGIRKLRIDPNVTTLLQVILIPLRGSIYLQIGDVPTAVDSIEAIFTGENGGQWSKVVPRKPKVYFSIDDIPHNTTGTLKVTGRSDEEGVLYSAETEITVNARGTNKAELSFTTTPGGLSLSAALYSPGSVVVSASLGDMAVAEDENGNLIITEIMYAANDSEYVELYNPKEDLQQFDTLYLEIDGTRRLFTGISIAAKEFLVIGRKELPWVDVTHSTASALDLSSTGNWITVYSKNSVVIDQVIFTGGKNDLEWPQVSGKRSICLKENKVTCSSNNYGASWMAATELIEGCSSQFGTPQDK